MNLAAVAFLIGLSISPGAFASAARAKSKEIFRLSAQSYTWLGLSRRELEREIFENRSVPLHATIGKLAWQGQEWEFPDNPGSTVSFEPQLMLPAQREDWDDDWVASTRLISRVRYEASPALIFTLRDSALFHLYRKGGYNGDYGPRASRIFENRVKVAAEISLVRDRVTLTVPVTYKQVKHANYQTGAQFNDRWRHSLWIDPELAYYFSGDNYVSLAYESDTFISSRFDKFYFLESLAAGGITAWLSLQL